MKVGVVIPWRDGGPERGVARAWVQARFTEAYPDWSVIEGTCDPDRPFNRAEAIVRGALQVDADVLVVHDADVWLAGDLHDAVDAVTGGGWAVPHWHLRRLTFDATARVYGGARLTAALDVEEVYKGNATGTLVVMSRDLLLDVPPDVRFVGWGQEDEAWGAALKLLGGPFWRGGADLYHLWHPPPERLTRVVGSELTEAVRAPYDRCARSATAMRELVDESKILWSGFPEMQRVEELGDGREGA